jgi:hypothetical protein
MNIKLKLVLILIAGALFLGSAPRTAPEPSGTKVAAGEVTGHGLSPKGAPDLPKGGGK